MRTQHITRTHTVRSTHNIMGIIIIQISIYFYSTNRAHGSTPHSAPHSATKIMIIIIKIIIIVPNRCIHKYINFVAAWCLSVWLFVCECACDVWEEYILHFFFCSVSFCFSVALFPFDFLKTDNIFGCYLYYTLFICSSPMESFKRIVWTVYGFILSPIASRPSFFSVSRSFL